MTATGPITQGVDFNHYQQEVLASASFPEDAQVIIRFRGPQKLIFVCTAGSVEYSFNGNTVHGVVTTSSPDDKLDFGFRPGKKIWLRGTGTIRIHAYNAG